MEALITFGVIVIALFLCRVLSMPKGIGIKSEEVEDCFSCPYYEPISKTCSQIAIKGLREVEYEQKNQIL